MKYRLTPIAQKIMNVLRRYNFEIIKMKGDHIKINKILPMKRPIILVNVKRLSNKVRQNLIKEAEDAGVPREELEKLF
ncbi:MAG: hypothetical protein KKF50_01050 [Nanoarchaeota archaeon]|nr:hypothetical protein [Nanoarchaeota archaeon]